MNGVKSIVQDSYTVSDTCFLDTVENTQHSSDRIEVVSSKEPRLIFRSIYISSIIYIYLYATFRNDIPNFWHFSDFCERTLDRLGLKDGVKFSEILEITKRFVE